MNENLLSILNEVEKQRFTTLLLLSEALGLDYKLVNKWVLNAENKGYLTVERVIKPHLIALTWAYCQKVGLYYRKIPSLHAKHQILLRNKIELEIKNKNKLVEFVDRKTCWGLGLYPAVGEWLLSYDQDNQKKYALIVIDDYIFKPSRIKTIIERVHKPDHTKVSHNLSLRWFDVVEQVIVYCVCDTHMKRHEKYIKKLKPSKPVKVRKITPIYSLL